MSDDAVLPVAPGSRALTSLLVLGVVAGAVLAGAGLLRTDSAARAALPADAVARVNDRVLTRDLVERVARDVADKNKLEVDAPLRRRIVDGLIDEELLVQRGIALGLPRIDRRVRAGLARAAIERIVQEQPRPAPSDAELQAFLVGHPEIFAPAAKLRVQQMVFRIIGGDAGAALWRAQRAAERLRAGEDFAVVRAADADPELAPLPDALLTRAKLLDYLGPSVVQAAAALAPGASTDPIRSASAYHIVRLLERDAAALPELARVRAQVIKEFHRAAGDRWLRATLDRLRAEAEITLHE